MIPPDITRDEILAAFKEIDETGEPVYREAKKYSLIYQNKQYSPKYLLSVTTRLKTGRELPSKEFDAKTAKNFFIDFNFPVLNKDDLETAIFNLKEVYPDKDRYKEMGYVISSRDEVLSKYSSLFRKENIDNVTMDDLLEFLEFKNNRHWTGLTRTKKGYVNNPEGVKKILRTLLDENLPIAERFSIIENIADKEEIKGIGKGILTAVLHVAYPDRYGVWNGTSEGGLKAFNIWPTFRSKATEGEKYLVINELLAYLSKQVGVDLWILDALWWRTGSISPSSVRYWKIAPDEQAREWPSWNSHNFIAIYWSELLDHTGEEILMMSHDEIVTSYQEAYSDNPGSTSPRQISNFISEMKIGDKIVVNNGKKSILAYGEVVSDPIFEKGERSKIIRKVSWEQNDIAVPIPESIQGKFRPTLVELTGDEYTRLTGSEQKYQISQYEPISDEYQRLDRLLIKKGQVILYGPPGTGKTYHANTYIETKIRSLPKGSDPTVDLNQNFYWFTINPNRWDPENLWKLEEVDLWYGNIKSAFSEIEESDLVFCYVSGPDYHRFTGIATCIRKTYTPDGIPQVFIKGIRKIDGPDWKTLKDDGILSSSLPVRTGARGSLFSLTHEEGLRLLAMNEIPPGDLGIEKQVSIQEIKPRNTITFHPSFSYEEFIEGIMPNVGTDGAIQYQVKEGIFKSVCRTAYNSLLHQVSIEKTWNADSDIPGLTQDEKDLIATRSSEFPHFLMIDEINRGDISRIFGELITLLEKDKRATGTNELRVILPYSRTAFAIPPNLYIIGTMNTADKSIALVDVALRRRFGFIEMLPDQTTLREYLSHDSLEIQRVFTLAIEVLEEINNRIIREFDRDHQIGHSYLMRLKECDSREDAVSEFWSIWYDEMMPLLQEYFYDAPTRLHAVIGDGFVEYNTHSLIIKPEKEEEEFLDALLNILNTESE